MSAGIVVTISRYWSGSKRNKKFK